MCSTFASELLRDLEDDCQLVISILAAIATTFGMTSCM
ncbi:smalltalk protein [Hallella absiana]